MWVSTSFTFMVRPILLEFISRYFIQFRSRALLKVVKGNEEGAELNINCEYLTFGGFRPLNFFSFTMADWRILKNA